MIIINQDKNNVINYDNVKSLWIEDNVLDETNTTFYINADEDFLGEYETEERAKEVLQEIVSKYKTTLYNPKTNETVVNVPKVYEMPTK